MYADAPPPYSSLPLVLPCAEGMLMEDGRSLEVLWRPLTEMTSKPQGGAMSTPLPPPSSWGSTQSALHDLSPTPSVTVGVFNCCSVCSGERLYAQTSTAWLQTEFSSLAGLLWKCTAKGLPGRAPPSPPQELPLHCQTFVKWSDDNRIYTKKKNRLVNISVICLCKSW